MSDKKSLSDLFEAAIAIKSPEERARFVGEHCGDNAALREELGMMLRSDAQVGDFMEDSPSLVRDAAAPSEAEAGKAQGTPEGVGQSVLSKLQQTLDVPHVVLQDTDVTQPDHIEPLQNPSSIEIPNRDADSRYQLQGEIARGGMGAIIKGRDVDLGRDLAIKVLLDEHKARPEVIQRFIEEAQIGGQLQHPGIAPVYELGQFDDQRPYFSMKLVKGTTLSKLLSKRTDPAQDRARLLGIFEQICQTMGYAHVRGVIHRDLKPANIMVGSFGEVQVMDWGLAKVLANGGVADEKEAKSRQQDESITVLQTRRSIGSDISGLLGSGPKSDGSGSGSSSSETQMGSVMGTPAYMPPEQALGEVDQLNQRSDVFGLGAILCEILTGQPPYVGEDSTAVFRLASRGDLEDAHARLDASGADGELIALAKQCLSGRPSQRPADAGALAEQVTGYLESVETKLRQTEIERAAASARAVEQQKRFRTKLTLAATALLALGLGIAGTTWQAFRANKLLVAEAAAKQDALQKTRLAEEAQKDAEDAKEDAEQISQFLTEVFQSPGPEKDSREIKVVEVLQGAVEKLEKLADQPSRQNKLREALAKTYSGLGLFEQAVELQEKVYAYYAAELGEEAPDTAGARFWLASWTFNNGPTKLGVRLMEEQVKLASQVWGPQHVATRGTMNRLAYMYLFVGRYDEAIENTKELLRLRRLLEPELADPEMPDQSTLAIMNVLGLAYRYSGQYEKAINLHEQCVEGGRKIRGEDSLKTFAFEGNLAGDYAAVGRFEDAIKVAQRTLPLKRKKYGREHPEALSNADGLAGYMRKAGRLDEAITLLNETWDIRRRLEPPQRNYITNTIGELAQCYLMLGRDEEALEVSKEGLEFQPDNRSLMNALAWGFVTIPDEDGNYPHAERAVALAREACELRPDYAVYENTLGTALYRDSQCKEATRVLTDSIEHGNDTPYNWLFIAMAHWQLDHKDEAQQWYDKCLAWQKESETSIELQSFFDEASKLIDSAHDDSSPSSETD